MCVCVYVCMCVCVYVCMCVCVCVCLCSVCERLQIDISLVVRLDRRRVCVSGVERVSDIARVELVNAALRC